MQKRKNDSDLQSELEAELMPDEDLMWAGQPDPLRLALTPRHLWPALMGLLWLGFIALFFGGFGFFRFSGFGGMFTLIPLIFLGVGLWQVAHPLVEYLKANSTVYAVTNRRAIIASGLFARSVQSYSPTQMQFIDTRVHGSGTGDIIFRREERPRRVVTVTNFGYSGRYYTAETGFFGVRNPREVEALMLDLFMTTRDEFEKPKR